MSSPPNMYTESENKTFSQPDGIDKFVILLTKDVHKKGIRFVHAQMASKEILRLSILCLLLQFSGAQLGPLVFPCSQHLLFTYDKATNTCLTSFKRDCEASVRGYPSCRQCQAEAMASRYNELEKCFTKFRATSPRRSECTKTALFQFNASSGVCEHQQIECKVGEPYANGFETREKCERTCADVPTCPGA